MSKMNQNSGGGLVISHDVIASIALNAIKDIEGISRVAHRPSSVQTLFKLKNDALNYVDVSMKNQDIELHLYLVLTPDAKIPSVTEKVQRKVKDTVQNMTSKIVSRIDIDIVGIDFPGDEEIKEK